MIAQIWRSGHSNSACLCVEERRGKRAGGREGETGLPACLFLAVCPARCVCVSRSHQQRRAPANLNQIAPHANGFLGLIVTRRPNPTVSSHYVTFLVSGISLLSLPLLQTSCCTNTIQRTTQTEFSNLEGGRCGGGYGGGGGTGECLPS